MKRRCEFLDRFPAFNYNDGGGEVLKDAHGNPIRIFGRVLYTDTKTLGSTLMETMLKEVSDFCDPTIKENWLLKAHQQVQLFMWSTFSLVGLLFCTITDQSMIMLYLKHYLLIVP